MEKEQPQFPGLAEKPCISLQVFPFQPEINSIPAVKAEKAHAICHSVKPEDCPKKKNKLNITMVCFRIMRHNPKKAQGDGP